MAIETNTFPFKGLSIEVSAGDENEQAFIKYTQNGVIKEFRIDGNKSSKSNQEVIVFYNKFIKDSEGIVYNQDVLQSFNATEQESAAYFYNIPAEKIGLKTDQMSVNGLLYVLFGVLCFSPENGNFYPPITADFEISGVTYSVKPATEPEEQLLNASQSNNDGKIKVIPVDIIGNPTFQILGTEISNTTGEFTDLSEGNYRILVSSDAAEMPTMLIIHVGAKNQ